VNKIFTITLSVILFTSCKQYDTVSTKVDIVDGIRWKMKNYTIIKKAARHNYLAAGGSMAELYEGLY
jgi:hypothetical protein